MLFAALLLLTPTGLLDPSPRSVAEVPSEGLVLSASADAAWIDDDAWLGVSPGVGFELDLLALHLRLPLYLNVWDAPPVRDEAVPPCGFVRCRPFIRQDGTFEPTALSQIVERLRLGRPGDLLHVAGGPVFATLGEGRVTDRYASTLRGDRQSGLFATANLEPIGLRAEAVVGNLFVPQRMSSARLEVRPLYLLTDPTTIIGGFLSRARVSVEAGADLTAGDRPLAAAAAAFAWPVFEEGGWLSVTPFVAASTLYGLTRSPAPGVGASAGVRLELRVPFVGARLDVEGRADGPGHRVGVFSTLYEIERTRALAGSNKGLVFVPAPGGVGYAAAGEVALGDFLFVGARYVDDTAVGADTVEAWVKLAFLGLSVGGRAVRRGVTSLDDVVGVDARTVLALEGSVRVFGPLSVYGRWYRTPREVSGLSVPGDEVILGVSGDLVLAPGIDTDG